MADSWNPTTPRTWVVGEAVTKALLDQEVRDRTEALRAGLTDSSADADIWQAVKTGTLAARSAVTHKAGRQYRTTDTHELFISDGTSWRHCGGAGAFDDIRRANSANLNTNNPYQPAGTPWTMGTGTWDVNTDYFRLTGAVSDACVLLETSSLLDRPYTIDASALTGASQASIILGIILKYVDANNFLRVQLNSTSLAAYKRTTAGGNQLIGSATVPFSPAANTGYYFNIRVFGKGITCTLNTSTAFSVTLPVRHDDVTNAAYSAGTKVGFYTNNTQERFAHISVNF